jgi:hypothetical protein
MQKEALRIKRAGKPFCPAGTSVHLLAALKSIKTLRLNLLRLCSLIQHGCCRRLFLRAARHEPRSLVAPNQRRVKKAPVLRGACAAAQPVSSRQSSAGIASAVFFITSSIRYQHTFKAVRPSAGHACAWRVIR